jgi:hypothetical protein
MATRKVSVAPREAVVGVDPLERQITLFGVGLAYVMSLGSVYGWVKNSPNLLTAKKVAHQACAAGYHQVASLCEKSIPGSRADWALQFGYIFVCATLMLVFALRRSRTGIIFASLMLGLRLGIAGIVFLYVGVWLLIRAYRLQKYGDPTLFGSSRIQRELSQARRAGKAITAEEAAEKAKVEINTPRPAVRESSRYTPKRNTQRRRK